MSSHCLSFSPVLGHAGHPPCDQAEGTCTLAKGAWGHKAYATDAARNAQRKAGDSKLIVKRIVAEPIRAMHRALACGRGAAWLGCHQSESAMRPLVVVVAYVLLQSALQMAPAEHEEMVQALARAAVDCQAARLLTHTKALRASVLPTLP